MIEKGLCMRPRRQTFAASYIEATVRAFVNLSPVLDIEEREWIGSVLATYADATELSDDSRVKRAVGSVTSSGLLEANGGESAPYPVGHQKSPFDQTDLETLASQRTSVRWFTPERVPREVVDVGVATALQAPTACNRVPWHVRIFDDADSAQKVAALAMGTAGYLDSVRNVAVFVGDQSAYFDERDRHLIYIDASLASMSFVLSLQAAGVSSCCINWPDIPKRESKMAELLGLEAYERVIMLVAFGYADPTGLTPYSGKKSLDATRSYG
ncbi:hypothetical protein ASG56_07035 [Rhodococcus sp. Leaf7]|nr:hypothetical protein ASG56_07035 [Rhodococcus sp. Leaf7]KQU42793.1 hypothetical protein ASG64_07035 [Rhodococcus sp. Leaf247]